MGHASRLFNGTAEQTLYGRLCPSQEQREYLQHHWNLLADHLREKLESRSGYPISTWIQGSYKFGTLIKPTRIDEEYDVDLGVYFRWNPKDAASPSPEQLRDWVQEELVSYGVACNDIKEIASPPKERCSRAIYKNQFHIDTPVYHLNVEKDSRRLACLSGKWEVSDPKKIYVWFKEYVSGDDREQLRRLVRYLKGWAAISFKDSIECRPSSIFLSVLVAEEFKKELDSRIFGMDDDDALIALIRRIHGRLFASRVVGNPVDNGEDLNRIPPSSWDGFLTQLQALRNVADDAADSVDEASAALAWSRAFSYLMPLPEEAASVEIADPDSGRAIMQLPNVRIEVFDRKSKRQLGTYENEVPSVPKDCRLVFTVTNPAVVPDFALVEWTVRNSGGEADSLGDIGHRESGIRKLQMERNTAYYGRHYMDCVVSVHGRVYAVRRIPVEVRDMKVPPRNPAKPAYVNLRSRFKRR